MPQHMLGRNGVRIFVGNGITIEHCEFTGLEGIAVVANHTSVRGLTVRGKVVRDTKATAMYFGTIARAGSANKLTRPPTE
jgi:hypothetical protein